LVIGFLEYTNGFSKIEKVNNSLKRKERGMTKIIIVAPLGPGYASFLKGLAKKAGFDVFTVPPEFVSDFVYSYLQEADLVVVPEAEVDDVKRIVAKTDTRIIVTRFFFDEESKTELLKAGAYNVIRAPTEPAETVIETILQAAE